MEYNQIPKTGTIGGMVDNINTNFQLTKEMLERLEVTKDHAVGLFSTLASLQAAHPTPEVGDWALVGDNTPFAIYKCTTAGTWSDTGGTYDGGSIDLADYAKKAEFDELDADVTNIKAKLGEGTSINTTYAKGLVRYTTGIYESGSSTSPINTSAMIPVTAGQKYAISGVSGYVSVLIVALFAANDGSAADIPNSVRGNEGTPVTLEEFVIPEGINYIRLSYNSTIDDVVPTISLLGDSIFPTKAELEIQKARITALENAAPTYQTKTAAAADKEELEQEIQDIADSIGADVSIPLTWNYGFIKHSDGVETPGKTTSTYRYSDMIPVAEGQTYTADQVSGSGSVNLISMYADAESNASVPLSTAGDGYSTPQKITFTIPSGITFIRLGYSTTTSEGATLTRNYDSQFVKKTEFAEMEEEVAELSDRIDTKTTDVRLTIARYPAISPRKATIIFQMDWGTGAGTHFEEFDDALRAHGIPKATYIIRPNKLELTTMRLMRDRGNEIGLHTDEQHYITPSDPAVTPAQMQLYLNDWLTQLHNVGFDDLPGIVCRTAKVQEALVPTIKANFAWMIGVSGGSQDYAAYSDNYMGALNTTASDHQRPMRLGLELTPEQVTEFEQAVIDNSKAIIDAAVEQKGLIVFYGHFYNDASKQYCITQATLTAILDYLQPLIINGQVVVGGTCDMLNYYFTKRVNE